MKDSSHSSLRVRTGSWLWLVCIERLAVQIWRVELFSEFCADNRSIGTQPSAPHTWQRCRDPPPTHTQHLSASLILWSPVTGHSTTRHKMDFVFFSPVSKMFMLISFIIWVNWSYIQNKVKCKFKHIPLQILSIKKTKLNGNVFTLKKTLSWTPGPVFFFFFSNLLQNCF